jgi:hypothetical protein
MKSSLSDPIEQINEAMASFGKGCYADAAQSFYQVACRCRQIDVVLYYQMRICSELASLADQPTGEPNTIKQLVGLLSEAIDETRSIEDRGALIFGPLMEYYALLSQIALKNVSSVKLAYEDRRSRCHELSAPLDILCCISAALFLIDQSLSTASGGELLSFVQSVKTCVQKCIMEKSSNTAISEVLNVVDRCLREVESVARKTDRSRPLCLDKANALRQKYGALSGVHKLLETIIPNQSFSGRKENVMKVQVTDPKGPVTVIETAHGGVTVYDQDLNTHDPELYRQLEVAERALTGDPNVTIPESLSNTAKALIESKRTTEVEFALKFPLLSAKWKRQWEKKRE